MGGKMDGQTAKPTGKTGGYSDRPNRRSRRRSTGLLVFLTVLLAVCAASIGLLLYRIHDRHSGDSGVSTDMASQISAPETPVQEPAEISQEQTEPTEVLQEQTLPEENLTPEELAALRETIGQEQNKEIFLNLARVGQEFDPSNVQDNLAPYLYHEFYFCRYAQYQTSENGYVIVSKTDILGYIHDVFGLQLQKIPSSVIGSAILGNGDSLLIGGAGGGDIGEYAFEGLQENGNGYDVMISCHYENGEAADCTYAIRAEKNSESPYGFKVTGLHKM